MAERVYQALRSSTRWLKWLLFGWLALSLVQAMAYLAILLRVTGMPVGASLANQGLADGAEGIAALFLLGCIVAFCFWIYRANANLHAFGVGDIHSPGWAVGSFFIPIASLWLGYGIMREVWNKSGPPDSVLDGKGWLLPIWWGAWIVSNILSNILMRMERYFEPTTWTVLQLAEPAINLIAGAALVVIISNIDIAQSQQESVEVF